MARIINSPDFTTDPIDFLWRERGRRHDDVRNSSWQRHPNISQLDLSNAWTGLFPDCFKKKIERRNIGATNIVLYTILILLSEDLAVGLLFLTMRRTRINIVRTVSTDPTLL